MKRNLIRFFIISQLCFSCSGGGSASKSSHLLRFLSRADIQSRFMMALLSILCVFCCISCGGGENGNGGTTANATTTTYTLSGTVSGVIIKGVTITLSGAKSNTTTTDSSGAYSFTVTAGSYTITPSLSGYTFSPSSSTKSVSSNATGVNFTSSASTSTIGDRTDYTSITLTSGGTYSSGSSSVSRNYYEYTSATPDTPAIKVAPGGSLTLTHSKANKSGGATTSTENSGFYGFNSGVLASSSSSTSSYVETNKTTSVTMTDCTITTSAAGANGAFAFGQGATVNLDYVTIVTTGSNNARGVDATYGGTVNITNSTISTQGGSCAALATDRYQGATAPTINAQNVTGTTAGTGSPGIYCTGTFTVSDSTLTATGSEAAVIEGLNSVTLTDTNISGAAKWGVMIYQSMSGDSSIGTGSFSMTNGALTNGYASGPAFFVCNTDAVITLNGATIDNSSTLLLVAGKASTAANYINNVNSSWGTSGGVVTFTAQNQTLAGSVLICDSASSIALTLTNSTFQGEIDSRNLGGANIVTLDANSTWTLTGNSFIKTLNNHGGTINKGGYALYVNGIAQ
jgi:hypothetical protein